MAATAITPAQAELINSLTQDEVPIKLRCAICSKLAVNAYKLPCCEQAICETCQSTLPPSCPVCEHSPLSASDCNPNKALRTTIRVFLKTEEKKRGIGQPKEKDVTPVTPVEPKDVTPSVVAEKASEAEEVNTVVGAAESKGEHDQAALSEEPKDDPVADKETEHQASTDVQDAPSQEHGPDEPGDNNNVQLVEQEGGDVAAKDDDAEQVNESKDNDEAEPDGQQNGDISNGFGFDAANGGFQKMNFGNGDLNQMQMMMAMQNGMGPNGFGGFPMMAGMSGMMDPMMMQNMYMNGGFGSQGMGMNGMMGMGGFNGGVGSGSDNNWNDQQSWNVGQDNFNHQNASGMGNGDYGNFNSGFQTGYNQGNFGHHNQFNDYRGNRYGYGRGRGRGRGGYGYGRGGYGYGMNGNYGAQNWMSQQYSADMAGQAPNDLQSSGDASGEQKQADNVDEFGRTLRPDENTAGDTEQADTSETGDKGAKQEGTEEAGAPENTAGDDGLTEGTTKPIPALGDTSSASNGDAVSASGPSVIPTGPMAGYQNYNRGGSFGGMPPPAPAADVPLNAPKGPKAMRQGLPNTSLLNLRARGYHIPGETIQSPKTVAPAVASPADRPRSSRSSSPDALKRRDSEQYHKSSREHDKERDRSRERERRDRDRDRGRSRSPSRSRSRDRRDSRKRRRHHSQSASDDERDDDYHRRRHRRKHSTYGEDDESAARSRDEKHEERSRSASPDDSRRSSHRSRKDRDFEKRRERDKDRDRDRDRDSDYEYRRKSSHRSRRDRDYDREYDRDRGKDRVRDRDRDRDRNREHRHRSRRSSAEPPTPVESQEKEFNPPAGPRAGSVSHNSKGMEISGANNKSRNSADPGRRSSQSSQRATPTAPAAALDPHAAEREARNRERLLRETQRLAGLAGFKRKSDDGEDAKRSRRKGRRGDVVTADDEEARMRRLEAERERSRWS